MNVSHTNTDTNIPRVPQCLSPHWNWGPRLPLPPCSEWLWTPPPWTKGGGGHARLRARGWWSPNSHDWRKSRALCLLCDEQSPCRDEFLVILPNCKNTRSSDLRLTSGGPLLRSLIIQFLEFHMFISIFDTNKVFYYPILLCLSQYGCQETIETIGQKKAISYSLFFKWNIHRSAGKGGGVVVRWGGPLLSPFSPFHSALLDRYWKTTRTVFLFLIYLLHGSYY